MKILHIDSSILSGASLTRELSAAVIDEIRHLDGAIASGFPEQWAPGAKAFAE